MITSLSRRIFSAIKTHRPCLSAPIVFPIKYLKTDAKQDVAPR